MFLQSLVELINYILVQILPPTSGEDQKKSSPHSGSISVRNFGILVAKWLLLAKS